MKKSFFIFTALIRPVIEPGTSDFRVQIESLEHKHCQYEMVSIELIFTHTLFLLLSLFFILSLSTSAFRVLKMFGRDHIHSP